MSKYTGQPDPPAHTVGGACQPPSRKGGYDPGTMWCCPICQGLWYVGEVGYQWRYLIGSRPDETTRPPLELPTEPTWGIAIVHTHKIAYAGKWTTKRDGDQTLFIDVLPGGITTGAAGVTAFVPLIAEQIRQIEAAR